MADPTTPTDPAEAEAVAAVQAHLDRGDPLIAYDLAQGALARSPGHVRLRQLQGLALARSGDVARAHSAFSALGVAFRMTSMSSDALSASRMPMIS